MQIVGTDDLLKALRVEDVQINEKMKKEIDRWNAIFEGRPDWKTDDVYILNTAAAVCSEYARLVTIEMEAEATGSPRADYINYYIQMLVAVIRQKLEAGNAGGDMDFVPFLKDLESKKLGINYIRAGDHWPFAWGDDGQSTGELFFDYRTIGDQFYIRADKRLLEGNVLTGSNTAAVADVNRYGGSQIFRPAPLSAVPDWANLPESYTIQGLEQPNWAQYKVPLANPIDPASPMGVSCFSRAIDPIKQMDLQWTRLINEYDLGEFAAIMDETAFRRKDSGEFVLPKKRLFTPVNVADMFKEWAPQLRDTSYIDGLNEIAARIEDHTGLARGTFSDRTEGQALTATQIKILKQRTYTTVVDMQKALENAIRRFAYAVDFYATTYNLAPPGEYELSFHWDDSIVVDSDMERQEAYQWVREGNMAFWRYLVDFKGYSEDDARRIVEEAREAEGDDDLPGEE